MCVSSISMFFFQFSDVDCNIRNLIHNVRQMVEVNSVVVSVYATTIQLAHDVNGSSNHHHSTLSQSIASASLIGTSAISLSGKSPIFLPDYIVAVNISANFSGIRVFLNATSPSLSFIPKDKSYIDLTSKCAMGDFVDSSSYSCVKCPNGRYSNQVDSLTCRFESLLRILFHNGFCRAQFLALTCFFSQFLFSWYVPKRSSNRLQAMLGKLLQVRRQRKCLSALPAEFFQFPASRNLLYH